MTRKAQYDHAALAKTLDAQLYVISRAQALACGLTASALRHRTRPSGPWRILLPGVYLVDSREPSVLQREVAATLYAGDGSMITGVAALWRHDIRHPLSDIVDVLVPAPMPGGPSSASRSRSTRVNGTCRPPTGSAPCAGTPR